MITDIPGDSWGVVVLWRHLVPKKVFLPCANGRECAEYGVFLSTSNRSAMGDSSVYLAKNIAMSKSQSQLLLKHMLLSVYGCCHRNISQVPIFPHLHDCLASVEGEPAYGNIPCHKNKSLDHMENEKPTACVSNKDE